jgi:hypothetical protein
MNYEIKYLDKNKKLSYYHMEEVLDIDLVGSKDGNGFVIIGQRQDSKNDCLEEVYDVLNEENLPIEVPRDQDGISLAFV